ncbi:MAG: SPOR domain-containing protein [Spirochaetales bacterium]|nr:SPOR domain-containing protein [Spirochaetales bacterium]
MEQQKILWIIFSVTFFLAAVVVGGLILLKPGADRDVATAGTTEGSGTETRSEISPYDFRDLLNREGALPAPGDEADGSLDVAEQKPGETALEENPELANAIDNLELEVTSGSEMRNAANRDHKPAEKATTTAPVRQKPPVQQNVQNTAAAATSKAQPRKTTDYWIQLASYTKKSSAEQAQEKLLEINVTTSIFTKEVEGTTWYRLRYGPCQTESEANKFLEWIKVVPGYEASWVDPEQVTR